METKTEKPVDGPTLDFERPIVELEKRIDELQQLTGAEVDLQTEIKALQKRVESITVGYQLHPKTKMGPLVSKKQLDN